MKKDQSPKPSRKPTAKATARPAAKPAAKPAAGKGWDKKHWLRRIKDPVKRERVARRRIKDLDQKTFMANMKRKHDRDCAVCVDPNKETIEQRFLEWEPLAQLGLDYSLDEKDIRWHCIFLGLFKKRDLDRKQVYHTVIRKGMEKLMSGETDVEASAIIKANDSLVRMEGGFLDKVQWSGQLDELAEEIKKMTPEEREGRRREEIKKAIYNPNLVPNG